MSGEFTLEDRAGEIIFASSPGMQSASASKTLGPKKSKPSAKRANKRPLIEIFNILSEYETDPVWADRFGKMAMYKFLQRISWVPNTTDTNVYGELVYKNRQIEEKTKVLKDTPIDEVAETLKFFIRNYTNVEMESETRDEDDIKVINNSKITPMPWNKLASKDQSNLLTDYIKDFAAENSIDRESQKNLIRDVILFSMGRNIVPFIKLDEDGKVYNISNIYKDSEGVFRLKTPP